MEFKDMFSFMFPDAREIIQRLFGKVKAIKENIEAEINTSMLQNSQIDPDFGRSDTKIERELREWEEAHKTEKKDWDEVLDSRNENRPFLKFGIGMNIFKVHLS